MQQRPRVVHRARNIFNLSLPRKSAGPWTNQTICNNQNSVKLQCFWSLRVLRPGWQLPAQPQYSLVFCCLPELALGLDSHCPGDAIGLQLSRTIFEPGPGIGGPVT